MTKGNTTKAITKGIAVAITTSMKLDAAPLAFVGKRPEVGRDKINNTN